MTSNHSPRLGATDLPFEVQGRLFETDAATPCRVMDSELWFSPFRDRERAAKHCMACPFLGRCGYNAVASRATHGVWGGQVLPGDFPGLLDPDLHATTGTVPSPPPPRARRRARPRSARR